jgi:hypothetical protein
MQLANRSSGGACWRSDFKRAVISKVFGSDTVHRCVYIWHEMRNARDYLGVLYGSVPDLKYELKAVNNFSLTVSEFEKN